MDECTKLYNYAISGTENYREATASIEKVGDFTSDGNNMVQTLKVSGNKEIGSYDVKLTNFPTGTTYNKNSNIVKIIIPKSSIVGDINGKVSIINAEVKTCPAFYGQSYNDNWQDYVTAADPYEKANTSTNITLKANNGIIKIAKEDVETKELISDTTLKIEKDGQTIKTVTTNKNGEAVVEGLYPGTYKITETKANDNYVLTANATQEVTIKYGETATVKFTNTHKKGNLKIIKVDKDDNDITLGAVEFDLIDNKGNIIKHLVTDINGIAIANNLNTGIYILRETLTKKEYNLAIDKDVTVEWNKTAEIKVENEKKKGQIKIIKIDSDHNEIRLENVEFQVINKNNYIVETIKTDSNGEASTSMLPIGEYKIKESSLGTNEEYILNNEIKTITVEENKIKSIQFENEHKKGNLKIYKVDLDNENVPVSDVEFEVIDQEGYKYKTITNEEGVAYIENIRSGIATIKETKTNKIYKLNDETYSAEIKWNETAEVTIKNEKLKGQIEVYKVDEEDNTYKLEGVEFQVINANNEIVETITTNSEGYAITSKIPIGEYILKETKTDNMHILNDETIKINVETDIISKLNITNKRIKGQIKIVKTSEDDNFINGEKAGTPIENVKFEIYNSNNEIVDTIITNENGIAITKLLDKGKYKIKEIEAGKWYLLNENEFAAEINIHKEVVEVNITNESEKPNVDIEKDGIIQTTANQEIRYDFKLKNTGNVPLSNFTWYDYLPSEVRMSKLITGTYNQDLNYSIYYKTNLNDYKLLVENLNTQVNNYIDFSNVKLEEGEIITEFKADFGTVDVGFESVINPYIFVIVNNTVKNVDIFTNKTRIEGDNKGYLVWDEDEHTTKVYEKEIKVKKLPRTGY